MMYSIDNQDLKSLTVNNASPVLLGVKPSSLILVSKSVKGYSKWLEEMNSMGISVYPMYCVRNKLALLIYDDMRLMEYLSENRAYNYLVSIGYGVSSSIKDYLMHLKLKLRRYQFFKGPYPHEIGIFLGYPIEDVIDFMDKTKPCKASAYWKVYNDLDKAMRIIDSYNQAKHLAINMYNKGYSIKDIVGLRGAM